ncbi:anti-sigma factor domain-containing protein [Phosphitispora sp. TUW77]|uniref:anti-sigma-I factor RsgI family protein n=1 Tax=Phosphitispora sp. TUW77 TaxID=3152361 RepID=UPI003AB2931F
MKIRGLVVKVKSPYYIILTNNGTYHKVPISGNPSVNVGTMAEFSTAVKPFPSCRFLIQAALAASLLIVFMGFGIYNMFPGAEPAAYVSLDINPSIELEIDNDLKVTDISLLNSDAAKLMAGMSLKGSNLSTAVQLIMSRALQNGYLKHGEKNLVLSTITLNKNPEGNLDFENLARCLENPIVNEAIDMELVIAAADKTLRDEADKQGLSTGKMLVYKDALQSGKKLTLLQVKQNSVIQLQNQLRVEILKNYQQRVIRKVHVAGKQAENGNENSNNLTNDAKDKNQKNKNGNQIHTNQNNSDNSSSGKTLKDSSSQVNKNQPEVLQAEQNMEQNQLLDQNQEQNQEQNQLLDQNQEQNIQEEQPEQHIEEIFTGSEGQSGITETNTVDSEKKQDSNTNTSTSSSEGHS